MARSLVITKISDGLGNQLFQYGVGRMLSIKMSVPLKLDLWWFRAVNIRPFQLSKFSMPLEEASENEIKSTKKVCYFKEKHFNYSAEITGLPKDLYLEGYWQSEKYFSGIGPVLRRELQISTKPGFSNQAMARRIQSSVAVAVHVRRGDYADNPVTNAIHGVCGEDYYRRAIELIRAKVSQPHFFIFSDDWDWVAQQFGHLKDSTIVAINLPDQGYEDLRLMSLCKHHIIANSTLSWWGAWLGDAAGQIVIAPKAWFRLPSYNINDLAPSDWVLL